MSGHDEPACPVCAGRRSRVVYDFTQVAHPTSVPGLVRRCLDCGLWWKVVSSDDAVVSAYGEPYAELALAGSYLESDATTAFFRKVLSAAHRSAQPRPRLLDVGAGIGGLVSLAQSMGFDAEGIELNPRLVGIATERGLNVRQARAEDLDVRGEYQVVTLMDLLEHVSNPLAVLERVRDSLRPGGELIVYTPNHAAAVVLAAHALASVGLDFAVREIFGRNHVTFFDRKTLRSTLDRAGFEVREMWSFPYDAQRPGQPMSSGALRAIGVAEWLGSAVGRVFRMVAFATKR